MLSSLVCYFYFFYPAEDGIRATPVVLSLPLGRSEERRVGKECKYRRTPYSKRKKKNIQQSTRNRAQTANRREQPRIKRINRKLEQKNK